MAESSLSAGQHHTRPDPRHQASGHLGLVKISSQAPSSENRVISFKMKITAKKSGKSYQLHTCTLFFIDPVQEAEAATRWK